MLAIRLLQLFSEDNRDLHKIVSQLGLFFQIRDDYANLTFAEVNAVRFNFAEDERAHRHLHFEYKYFLTIYNSSIVRTKVSVKT